MARTGNEEVVLTSEVTSGNKEEVKEEIKDSSVSKNTEIKNVPNAFILERELIEIGIKYARTLKDSEIPMNAQQIATLETLRNLYETLKN